MESFIKDPFIPALSHYTHIVASSEDILSTCLTDHAPAAGELLLRCARGFLTVSVCVGGKLAQWPHGRLKVRMESVRGSTPCSKNHVTSSLTNPSSSVYSPGTDGGGIRASNT